TETYSARQGVEHDNMNLICLGGRVIGPELARELIFAFIKAHYTGEIRHQRRLKKLEKIEGQNFK
ncbi:MAG TPA: RpiB/LacA/LacB family sugar-phosphate isomerase, partial [Saprospiraceae bacterium]|nr:RpiB/LacA/LacB family sugar-phosphate isomerase [Saprospiraceae bacterium]